MPLLLWTALLHCLALALTEGPLITGSGQGFPPWTPPTPPSQLRTDSAPQGSSSETTTTTTTTTAAASLPGGRLEDYLLVAEKEKGLLLVKVSDSRTHVLDIPLASGHLDFDLAFDPVDLRVYWTNATTEAMWSVRLEAGSDVTMIPVPGLRPSRPAVDFEERLVFVVDLDKFRIVKMTTRGGERETVLDTVWEPPTSLSLDMGRKWIYYSTHRSGISRVRYTGEQPESILSDCQPLKMTLDFLGGILFWIDQYERRIEGVNLDGTDRRVILENNEMKPYSLISFVSDTIFFTPMEKRDNVWKVSRNGSTESVVLLGEGSRVLGLHAFRHSLPGYFANFATPVSMSQLWLEMTGILVACLTL